jgi:hypothetical protein
MPRHVSVDHEVLSPCERADIGRYIFRFALRQRDIHPGMRVEQMEGKNIRFQLQFVGNDVEWRCIGHFPALIRHDRVTGHASRLSEPFADFGIGRNGHRRNQESRRREAKDKKVQGAPPATPTFAIVSRGAISTTRYPADQTLRSMRQ